VKFRKQQKGKRRGKACAARRSLSVSMLAVLECGYITDRQIEASRIAMTRFIQARRQDLAAPVPDKPITRSRPKSAWVGKGVGSLGCGCAAGQDPLQMEGVIRRPRARLCAWRRTSCAADQFVMRPGAEKVEAAAK